MFVRNLVRRTHTMRATRTLYPPVCWMPRCFTAAEDESALYARQQKRAQRAQRWNAKQRRRLIKQMAVVPAVPAVIARIGEA